MGGVRRTSDEEPANAPKTGTRNFGTVSLACAAAPTARAAASATRAAGTGFVATYSGTAGSKLGCAFGNISTRRGAHRAGSRDQKAATDIRCP